MPTTANDDVERSTSVLSNKSILKNVSRVRRGSVAGISLDSSKQKQQPKVSGPKKRISFNDYSFLNELPQVNAGSEQVKIAELNENIQNRRMSEPLNLTQGMNEKPM